jgi:hypothetical protein
LPKTFWDWLAYATIWVGAIMESVWYFSTAVPSVSEHVAPVFTDRLWALVPLVLLSISGFIMIIRAATAQRQVPIPARPLTFHSTSPIESMTGEAPVQPPVGSYPTLSKETQKRVYLDKAVTVTQLATIYTDNTQLMGDTLSKRYLGKWLKFSGTFINIRHSVRMMDGSGEYSVTLIGPKLPKSIFEIMFHCSFSEDWKDQLEIVERNAIITVHGRIQELGNGSISLDHCEIET